MRNRWLAATLFAMSFALPAAAIKPIARAGETIETCRSLSTHRVRSRSVAASAARRAPAARAPATQRVAEGCVPAERLTLRAQRRCEAEWIPSEQGAGRPDAGGSRASAGPRASMALRGGSLHTAAC